MIAKGDGEGLTGGVGVNTPIDLLRRFCYSCGEINFYITTNGEGAVGAILHCKTYMKRINPTECMNGVRQIAGSGVAKIPTVGSDVTRTAVGIKRDF